MQKYNCSVLLWRGWKMFINRNINRWASQRAGTTCYYSLSVTKLSLIVSSVSVSRTTEVAPSGTAPESLLSSDSHWWLILITRVYMCQLHFMSLCLFIFKQHSSDGSSGQSLTTVEDSGQNVLQCSAHSGFSPAALWASWVSAVHPLLRQSQGFPSYSHSSRQILERAECRDLL